MSYRENARSGAEQLALGLGCFSIGLGLAELLAPRSLARTIGMPDARDATLRTFGVREISNGVAILSQPDRPAWLWARTGGDALDISYLTSALNSEGSDRQRVAMAMAAVLGLTALDVLCARRLSSGDARFPERSTGTERVRGVKGRGVKVERVTTINKPIGEVYQFWRNLENLPSFMGHLESVQSLGGNRSRWRARGPAGRTVEWEAELLQDRPDEWIAWRSLPGAQVENSGSVRFSAAPGARGTEVRVQLRYVPPAGMLGRAIARLYGEEPDQQVRDDLHRFKQLMETGEIPLSGDPSVARPAPPADGVDSPRTAAGVGR